MVAFDIIKAYITGEIFLWKIRYYSINSASSADGSCPYSVRASKTIYKSRKDNNRSILDSVSYRCDIATGLPVALVTLILSCLSLFAI